MKRLEIVAEARRYAALKTPWRKHGRSERGLDCGGLICVLLDKFAVPYENYTGEVLMPDGVRLLRLLTEALIVRHPPLKPGMIILLQNFGSPLHLGVVGELFGKPSIIHVAANFRRASEETLSPDVMRLLHTAFDIPGVED